MARKKASPKPLDVPESWEDAADAVAELATEEPADDSPDVPALVVRFQMATEKALSEMRSTFDSKTSAAVAKVARHEDELRKIKTEMAQIREMFADLRETAGKAKSQMVTLLEQTHGAAQEAKEAAKVYERLSDTRPDLLRKIDDVNASAAEYKAEVVKLCERFGSLSRRVDQLDLMETDFRETKGTIDSIGNVVHKMHSASVLSSTKEARR